MTANLSIHPTNLHDTCGFSKLFLKNIIKLFIFFQLMQWIYYVFNTCCREIGIYHSGLDISVPVCPKQVKEVGLMIGNLVSYFFFVGSFLYCRIVF
jgi:hypothetical protein